MGSHERLPETDMLGDRPIIALARGRITKKIGSGITEVTKIPVNQRPGSPKRPGNADRQRGAEQIDHVIVEASAAFQ